MKTLKLITALMFVSFLGFISCQKEIDEENGQNPNTNSVNSETAKNLQRTAMYDGSFDDFLDGTSCSSVLFPVTVWVNNQKIILTNKNDYQLVLNILGEVINDEDTITFQFPISVKLSNYTEVQVENQAEYNAIKDTCEEAEAEKENAINCLKMNYPISILTYNISLEQTSTTVIESNQELYTYMSNFNEDEKFSIKYPISATLSNDTEVNISSDAEFKSHISDCLGDEDTMDDAQEDAETLENILVEGTFRVQSYINGGVDTANTYANYTIDFANDLTCSATNTANALAEKAEGTFSVTSEMEVFLTLEFSSEANFELLNDTWTVTNYSSSSITLQSTTNTSTALVLNQI
ncbi:hypothetical protein AXE80_05500 [Wenyingzhuangia fucanilytica]|uniref:Uncharacterized protein n=1 Tax=Wenyingzhuangia fucanilytica TaxID=1790137 RepID=A0A1B1Y4V2_9FLAO|nr:hypothetical protein [Wenyingzhuangia fucanilytica]ANW95767.1 hypothetical protein AXE80_05500 [Wenyingzhuangia fucanilytica]